LTNYNVQVDVQLNGVHLNGEHLKPERFFYRQTVQKLNGLAFLVQFSNVRSGRRLNGLTLETLLCDSLLEGAVVVCFARGFVSCRPFSQFFICARTTIVPL
jgi:hypothetical protein